jgi:hypothetical protein
MSTGSDTLYMTDGSTLYTLNTTTGAATLVGSSSSGVFGADVVVGGVIYGGSASPLAIYTLDGSNGAGTLIANVTGTSTNFWGLAPISQQTLTATYDVLRDFNTTGIQPASGDPFTYGTETSLNVGFTLLLIAGIPTLQPRR